MFRAQSCYEEQLIGIAKSIWQFSWQTDHSSACRLEMPFARRNSTSAFDPLFGHRRLARSCRL